MRPATHSGGSPLASSGWQRLQGRYPARIALPALLKNSRCSAFGRDGHDGRQKMPVVLTPKKNTPSKPASRFRHAAVISLSVKSDFTLLMMTAYQTLPPKK